MSEHNIQQLRDINIISKTMSKIKEIPSRLGGKSEIFRLRRLVITRRLNRVGESVSNEVLPSSSSQVYETHSHTDCVPSRKVLLFPTQPQITEHHEIAQTSPTDERQNPCIRFLRRKWLKDTSSDRKGKRI